MADRENSERYIRWEPRPDLPERQCSNVHVQWDGEGLFATVLYRHDTPEENLRLEIDFGWVASFEIYDEFNDPWMETRPDMPRLDVPESRKTYPFLEVLNSRWSERVWRRQYGEPIFVYRHLAVVTANQQLHVLTGEEPIRAMLSKLSDEDLAVNDRRWNAIVSLFNLCDKRGMSEWGDELQAIARRAYTGELKYRHRYTRAGDLFGLDSVASSSSDFCPAGAGLPDTEFQEAFQRVMTLWPVA